MDKLRILNSRETRGVLEMISNQFGTALVTECAFMQNSDDKVYLISRDLSRIDERELRIDSLGLYIGTISNGMFRPSIEGSQLIGKTAKKRVFEITREESRLWLRGYDLETKNENSDGFVLIKHGADFMGAGKIKEGRILNLISKSRKINCES